MDYDQLYKDYDTAKKKGNKDYRVHFSYTPITLYIPVPAIFTTTPPIFNGFEA